MPTFALFKANEKIGSVVGADPNKLKASFGALSSSSKHQLTVLHLQAALELHSESA